MTVLAPFIPHVRPSVSPSGGAPGRLRVLISAYAVSPARGSEPGLGWNLASRLARHHDVTVLCCPYVPGLASQVFRDEIEGHLRANGPVDGLTIRYVEPPFLSYWLQRESRIRRRTVYYAGYAAWQRAAYRAAAEMHAERPFDVVHQLNITGYREPGYLWGLPAPFVWGPIGGAADIPAAFFPLMGWQDRLFYAFRNKLNTFQKRSLRRPRAAARAARHIWGIGEENRSLASDYWGRGDAENMIESGATVREHATPRTYDGRRPLRLAWSGQHIGRKALPILLHALSRLKPSGVTAEVAVLGEGGETARWKALADTLGVSDRVRWLGQASHADALAEVSRADAFVLTSVQEGTPHVVLEALSLGLPVICHNACGMGVAVDQDSGIKVALADPQTSIDGFARAIELLSSSPTELRRLSVGALKRASELSWDRKADQIAETYRAAVCRPATGGGAG